MDPIVTYRKLLLALGRGHWAAAVEFAEDLAGWIDDGGFIPEGMDPITAFHGAPSEVGTPKIRGLVARINLHFTPKREEFPGVRKMFEMLAQYVNDERITRDAFRVKHQAFLDDPTLDKLNSENLAGFAYANAVLRRKAAEGRLAGELDQAGPRALVAFDIHYEYEEVESVEAWLSDTGFDLAEWAWELHGENFWHPAPEDAPMYEEHLGLDTSHFDMR